MQSAQILIGNQTATRLVVTINSNLAEKLKKLIPARKRSEFVEKAIANYLTSQEQRQWWERVQAYGNNYQKINDPIQSPAASWLKQDRHSH